MPLINTSVSNLIQGVSQQPDAVRFQGQCEEQENALASVVDGLQKRPACEHIKTLLADAALDENSLVHFIERDDAERYVVIIKNNEGNKIVSAYNLTTGVQATINERYIGVVATVQNIGDPGTGTGTNRLYTGTFTQPTPITVANNETARLGKVRVIGGAGKGPNEYDLHEVGTLSDKKRFRIEIPEADGDFLLYGDGTGTDQNTLEYTLTNSANADLTLESRNYATTGVTSPKEDLKLFTTGDVTYVLNTKKTVAKETTTSRPLNNEALVFIKQGDYDKKYGVRINQGSNEYSNFIYSGASQRSTGSGSTLRFYNTSQNAESTTILEALFGDSVAAVEDAKGENGRVPRPLGSGVAGGITSATNFTSELLSPQLGAIFYNEDGAFTIYPDDALAGEGIGVVHRTVATLNDLPTICRHRYKVMVRGDADAAEDDRYLQFLVNGSDSTTAAGTVGEGTWQETSGDEIENRIDVTTMPLMLKSTGVDTFELNHMPLDILAAGDQDTNPDPSFIGHTIDGAFQFKGRLGFLTGASVSMTEVKFGGYDGELDLQKYNFYRTSVTSLLDSDPIDVTISSSKVIKLRSAIAFQENLVLFSDFSQFVLRGGELLTPKTVAINPITEYEYEESVDPIALGSYIYFPFTRGSHVGVREFTVNSNTDVFDANEITAHVPQYIPQKVISGAKKGVVSMTGASSENLMALTDGTDIYIYKYFFSGNEKVLSAWSKFTLSKGGIRGIGFVDSDLFIVQSYESGSINQTHLLKIPLENKFRDPEGYNTHLDRRVEATFNADAATPEFTIPYRVSPDETLQVYTKDGLLVQNLASPIVVGNTTKLTFNENVVGGGLSGSVTVYVGVAYTMKYTFSEQIFKASSGDKMSQTNGRMLIRNGTLFFENTSHFNVKVTPKLRDTTTAPFNATVVQSTVEGNMPLESGAFRFPVFTNPKDTVITIENDSAGPCNLQSAEFESFVHQRSRRYA